SGLAIAALRYIFGNPSALQRMTQVWRQPLDGCHLLAGGTRHERHAGPHRLTIEVDGTSTTLRHATTVLRSRQTEVIPQDPEQRSRGIDIDVYALSVHAEGNHQNTSVTTRN